MRACGGQHGGRTRRLSACGRAVVALWTQVARAGACVRARPELARRARRAHVVRRGARVVLPALAHRGRAVQVQLALGVRARRLGCHADLRACVLVYGDGIVLLSETLHRLLDTLLWGPFADDERGVDARGQQLGAAGARGAGQRITHRLERGHRRRASRARNAHRGDCDLCEYGVSIVGMEFPQQHYRCVHRDSAARRGAEVNANVHRAPCLRIRRVSIGLHEYLEEVVVPVAERCLQLRAVLRCERIRQLCALLAEVKFESVLLQARCVQG